jgi:hypothetical protein
LSLIPFKEIKAEGAKQGLDVNRATVRITGDKAKVTGVKSTETEQAL